MSPLDYIVFAVFICSVVGVGLFMGRSGKQEGEAAASDYFLAGRGLPWWLIGFSLIAANISTEQFVGMSGQAADYVGLAIASYEWMAAITLVVVAFFFLPKFLAMGIFTAPEFLLTRYNEGARTIMAVFTMIIYIGVAIPAVIYSGALTVGTRFDGVSVAQAAWIIGFIATVYVAVGGLKACAWADLIQGAALIIAGVVILLLVLERLGETPVAALAFNGNGVTPSVGDDASGWTKLMELNDSKMHMVLPSWDLILPWTALAVGLWIPNFYYWGLNQYIIQRTLGSKSLAEGQKGIVFAAGMKLIVPFIIVLPGLAAFNLFSDEMAAEAKADPLIQESNAKLIEEFETARMNPASNSSVVYEFDAGWAAQHPTLAPQVEAYNSAVIADADAGGRTAQRKRLIGYKTDASFALLLKHIVPVGVEGFVFAALLGAVVSTLASMLNAASTIFTIDVFRRYIAPASSQKSQILAGRVAVVIAAVAGCLMAPLLANPKFGGVFTFIQEFQGFISPGILAVFIFGFFVPNVPRIAGVVGLILNPVIYFLLKVLVPNMAFLDRMAVSCLVVLLVLGLMTLIKPRRDSMPAISDETAAVALESSSGAKVAGVFICVATIALYFFFW